MSDRGSASGPRLSLCVITKNEQANLPRCLESVRGLADEVVVTDTGSTDRTVDIARSFGARVEHFEWCDDFSAAYNHGLAAACSDWILILDADEQLDPASVGLVRTLIEDETVLAYTVFRRDYFGERVRDDAFTEMLQTRLIRRRDAVRFRGRIHQQLEPSLSHTAKAEGRFVRESAVRILHHGFMGDNPVRKLDRSIRMLELELRERPGQFYYLVELGRSKLAKGDASGMEPLAAAAEMVACDAVPAGEAGPMVPLLLEQILAQDTLRPGFPLTHDRAEEIARDRHPDSVPLVLQRARRRFRDGQYEESASLMELARELVNADRYDKACSFNPSLLSGETTLNLGVCYAHMGRLEDAISCFEDLEDDSHHGDAARQNLEKLRGFIG